MSSKIVISLLLAILAWYNVESAVADPVLYLPPFELRSMQMDRSPYFVGIPGQGQGTPEMSHFTSFEQEQPQRSLKSITDAPPPIITTTTPAPTIQKEEHKAVNHSNEVHALLEALGINVHHEEEAHGRSASATSHAENSTTQARDYGDYPMYGDHYSYPYRWPQSYHSPPYPYVPPSYVESSHYSPPIPHIPKPAPVIPVPAKLPLLEVAKAPVLSKLGGLISIVKGILSGNIGSTLNGLPAHFIGGLLKSLTSYTSTAGGLKTLIAKLSIPILSLILINVEVLAVVWWLWDDCSESPFKAPSPPAYHYPQPAASYPSPSPYSYKYR